MEENLFLIGSVVYLLIVLFLLDFWDTEPEEDLSGSECHARTRYDVAEKIKEEFT